MTSLFDTSRLNAFSNNSSSPRKRGSTRRSKTFYVYILASAKNGTLYVGVTSNLPQRVWQHKEGLADGFTKKYCVKTLVWYEQHEEAASAITREKQLKKWNRETGKSH